MKFTLRRLAQITAGAMLALGFWQTGLGTATAHAALVASRPAANEILAAAPAEVRLSFSEAVALQLSQIEVIAQSGQPIAAAGAPAAGGEGHELALALPPLPAGSYLVSWRALSAVDGHMTSGSFSFGVGSGGAMAAPASKGHADGEAAPLSPTSAAARWLTLTGLALFLGAFAFRLFVLNPLFGRSEPFSGQSRLNRRLALTCLDLAAVGLLLVVAALNVTFLEQAGASNLFTVPNLEAWLATRFGRMWLARYLVTAAAALLLAFLAAELRPRREEAGGWLWWLPLLAAASVAATASLVSHSAALHQGTLLATVADLAHLLAAAVWVGGLFCLVLVLWQSRRLETPLRTWLNLGLMLNFSTLATTAVSVLLVSGGVLTWRHIGGWDLLVGTAYGRTLMVKIALVAAALGLAAVNLLVIRPRLHAGHASQDVAAIAAMRRFRLVASLELAFALLVLAAAGVLAESPLQHQPPGQQPMVVRQSGDDLNVELALAPAVIGQSQFDVYLTDLKGQPVVAAREVAIAFNYLDENVGQARGVATPLGDGHYRLEGGYLSLSGEWQLEVAIRRQGLFDSFVSFALTAGPDGAIRPAGAEPSLWQRGVSLPGANAALLVGALALLALGCLWLVLRVRHKESAGRRARLAAVTDRTANL